MHASTGRMVMTCSVMRHYRCAMTLHKERSINNEVQRIPMLMLSALTKDEARCASLHIRYKLVVYSAYFIGIWEGAEINIVHRWNIARSRPYYSWRSTFYWHDDARRERRNARAGFVR